MEVNPKIVKLVVTIFVVLLGIYNILNIIRGENVIINIIGLIVLGGAYYGYHLYTNREEED